MWNSTLSAGKKRVWIYMSGGKRVWINLSINLCMNAHAYTCGNVKHTAFQIIDLPDRCLRTRFADGATISLIEKSGTPDAKLDNKTRLDQLFPEPHIQPKTLYH